MEKFIKYTEELERRAIILLLNFRSLRKRIGIYELKIYLGIYVAMLIYFLWIYVQYLTNSSKNSLFINIVVILLFLSTSWSSILLIRIQIAPKYKKYDRKTLEVKKELIKQYKIKESLKNENTISLSKEKIHKPVVKKLILNQEYSHGYIASELTKLHKSNIEQIKPFVYHYFETSDFRKKFRKIFISPKVPEIGVNKDVYIEFYWVLCKCEVIKNTFTEVSDFLVNTFGKDDDSPFYNIESSTIQKYPSERNFRKKYSKEPSLRSFFAKIKK